MSEQFTDNIEAKIMPSSDNHRKPGGGCLKHISDTKDLLLAGAFKIHV